LHELDVNINDEAFARAMAEGLLAMGLMDRAAARAKTAGQ
jgi:hypothetical protein